MFGSLGVMELVLIFAVILIVFGPRRVPEIGRTLGKALGEFRKATDDLKSTIEREVRLEELKKITPPVFTPFESISRSEPVTFPSAATEAIDTSAAPELPDGALPVGVAEHSPADDLSSGEGEPASPKQTAG